MKKAFISFLFLLASLLSNAGGRLDFGLEFGTNFQFWKYSHYRFISADGSRADVSTDMFGTVFCPDIAAHLGTFVSNNDHISLYFGAKGIYDSVRVFPLSLRYTHYYGFAGLDRWLNYADIGAWYDFESKSSINPIAKVGGGYSFILGKHSRLELLAGFQTTMSHPLLFESSMIPQDKNLKNTDIPLGLVFTINITL